MQVFRLQVRHAILPLALMSAIAVATTASADDELTIDIGALRRELSSVVQPAAAADHSAGDVEADLQAQEEAILKKVQAANATNADVMVEAPTSTFSSAATSTVSDAELTELKGKVRRQEGDIRILRTDRAKMDKQLNTANARVGELEREVEKLRSRLLIADTEVERLSAQLEARNREVRGGGSAPAMTQGRARLTQPTAPAQKTTSTTPATGDMTIAQVVVNKAYLRSGPGAENAPLMSVARGARLVVETRQGEWYRIISPQGSRAWVHSSVIAFGGEPSSGPTRTLRIKGYDGSLAQAR